MRIQETNKILKEAAINRHNAMQPAEEEGLFTKVWRMVSHLPQTLTGLFKRH